MKEFAVIDRLYKDLDFEMQVILHNGEKKIIKKIKKDNDSYSVFYKLMLSEIEYYENNDVAESCLKPERIIVTNKEAVLVYEYQDFEPIANIISDRGMDIFSFLQYTISICNQLFELHKKEIHGWINPINILVNRERKSVLFHGVIQDSNSLNFDKPVYVDSELLNYISPEQTGLYESYIDYKTDLYSLGCVFYRMCTGKVPFEGIPYKKVLYNQATKSFVSPKELKNSIPSSVSEIVMKLLEKKKKNRYETVHGVKKDLEEVLNRIINREDEYLEIGKYDIPCRLNLPEDLFNRNQELGQLFDVYNRAREGGIHGVIVQGKEGFGRTSITKTFLEKIKESDSVIINIDESFALKSDYNKVISSILDQLLFYCLVNENIDIETIKEYIQGITKGCKNYLIELIPRIKIFLEDHKNAKEIEDGYIRKDVKYVQMLIIYELMKQIRVNDSLIIFNIDIKNNNKKNLDKILKRLLVINSVDKIMIIETSSPVSDGILANTFEKFADRISVSKIVLEELRIENIEKILLGTFNISEGAVKNISRTILIRTKGNPFLIKEYILTLYKKNGIYFDYETNNWNADLEKIQVININENLNTYLKEKFSRLPREVSSVLKICACLYGEFDSQTIRNLSGYNRKTVSRIISYCLKNRIIQEKNRFLNIESYNSRVKKLKRYVFESDNFKEIILQKMDDGTKEKYMYNIGSYYLNNQDIYNCKWFVAYCFLNTKRLPDDKITLIRLQELLHSKAEIKFSSGNYTQAYETVNKAIEVETKIGESADERLITLKLHAIFRMGNVQEAERYSKENFYKIRNATNRINAYIFMMDGYLLNGEFKKAEEIVDNVLGNFCNIEKINSRKRFVLEINKFFMGYSFCRKSIKKNVQKLLPGVDNQVIRELINMSALVSSYTNVFKFLFITFVDLLLNETYMKDTRFAFKTFKRYYKFIKNDMSKVTDMTVFEMFRNIDNMQLNNIDMKYYAIFGINSFYFMKQNEKQFYRIEMILENVLKYNEVSYLFYALNGQIIHRISQGDDIQDILNGISKYSFKLKESNNKMYNQLNTIKEILRSIKNGESNKYVIKESDMLTLKSVKAMAMFFNKDYNSLKVILDKDSDEDNFNSSIAIFEYGFYRSLILAENYEVFNEDTKKIASRIIEINYRAFDKVKNCDNRILRIKYMIVKCYRFYMYKDYDRALSLAHEISEISEEENYIMGMAISREIASSVFVKKKMKSMARMYLGDSKKKYSQISIKPNISIDNLDMIFKSREQWFRIGLKEDRVKYTNIKEMVDDLKVLSGEKNYKHLIKKIIDINLRAIDVESVIFFQVNNGNIIQKGIGEKDGNIVMQDYNFRECNNIPKTVINFVMKTKKKILINEAKNNQLFYFDKYILKNNVKSLACYPIIQEGEIIGILYLENKKYFRTFSEKFESVMEMIIGYVVISLSNAKDYNEISEKKTDLESLVQKKSEEIHIIEQKLIKEIQERVNVEKKLTKSKEKTEYFANLSHEFKTPLNVILSTIQLIEVLSEQEHEKKVKDYLKIMKQNCYRLLRLVNNLIDISKIDEGYLKLDMKYYNIISVIENISMSVVSYAQNKGISLIFDTEIEELNVFCDEEKIERIMLNILSNAIKFTPENGEISVDIKLEDSYVTISIKDSGIGIHKELQEKIFGRFEQVDKSLSRRQEGSGIGLALTKQLVEMQGGVIEIISDYGKGCEFLVKLPRNTIDYKEIEYDNSEKISKNHNFVEKIKIEFSDIYF